MGDTTPGGPTGPRVSVIIPTHNRAMLVCEAVRSVLAQTMGDLEVLVADDGSTDGTAAAVTGMGDRRVRHLPGLHSGEPATPRNRGLAAARAPWVAFLDSDDRWDPEKLERQLDAVGEGAWSFTGYRLERNNAVVREEPVPESLCGDVLPALLTSRVAAPISSVMAPTDAMRAIGGFAPETAFREDRDMMFLLAARMPARPVREVMVTITDHPARSTTGRRDHHTAWALVYGRFLSQAPRSVRQTVRQEGWRHLYHGWPRAMRHRRWWAALRLLAAG